MNKPTAMESELFVVFIHGLLSDKSLWSKVISHLTPPLSVINYEMGGFGASSHYLATKSIEDISASEQALHLSECLNLLLESSPGSTTGARTHKQIVLVSHGYGSVVAKIFVEKYGGVYDIQGMVLVSPIFEYANNIWNAFAHFVTLPILGDLIAFTPDEIARVALNTLLYLLNNDSIDFEKCSDMTFSGQFVWDYGVAGSVIKRLRALLWYSSGSRLVRFFETVDERVTFLCGSNDPISLRNAEDSYPALSDSTWGRSFDKVRLTRIKGSRHYLPLSDPALVARAILDMINDITTQKTSKIRGETGLYEVL